MIKRIIKYVIFRVKFKSCKILGDASLNSVFEGQNVIWDHTKFIGYLGFGTYVGRFCNLNGYFGRYCSIGSNVKTIVDIHPSKIFVSTHPVFYSILKQNGTTYVDRMKFEEHIYADTEKKYGIVVGNDVWIGDNVSIMGGITIADGAIIGANSLVTKDVLPYEIVGGVPARVIRKRFDDDKIKWLLDFQWWNKPYDWIREHAHYFEDIDFLRDSIEL